MAGTIRKSQQSAAPALRASRSGYDLRMDSLLECRPILHSRDIEETRAFLGARAIRLDVLGSERDREGFDVAYNGVYLPSLWLGFIRYGASVAAHVSPARGDYWVHFPLHGRMAIGTGWRSAEFDPGRAAVTSPLEAYSLKTDARGARLSLCIHGEALERHLAALVGDALRGPLRFMATMELDGGPGHGLACLVHAVGRDFCRSGMLSNPLVANDFEQLVMTSLLVGQPHSHSELLRRRQRRALPRDVRRAVEYIHEHAAQPITLGDLVRASGVPGRTLLKHFRDSYGVSPVRYLRNHRLSRVREELAGGEAAPVSHTALRWGFAHLGRFAAAYRRRFGESPSATRARGRSPA